MKFNNSVQADIHVDKESRFIHVLDLDRGGKTVTNGIDEIQDEILRVFCIPESIYYSNISDWVWFLYGTDGIICEFNKGRFSNVSYDNLFVHKPYVDVMKDRHIPRVPAKTKPLLG